MHTPTKHKWVFRFCSFDCFRVWDIRLSYCSVAAIIVLSDRLCNIFNYFELQAGGRLIEVTVLMENLQK